MNRVSTLIIGALFAIAAIEFGLLGASAAGLTGGSDNSLPPIDYRVGVEPTPTPLQFVTVTPCDGSCPPTPTAIATWTPGPHPTATPAFCGDDPCPTPTFFSPPSCDSEVQVCPTVTPSTPISPPQLSPPSVDATGIDIRANPLTINCDGYDRSTVTVRIFDANGNPVPDGTFVSFSPYNGNADPWYSYTYDGYAYTQVSFYGDIFPYGPNLIVESGLLQAGIRIRCNPQSNPCPESWPESPPVSGPCVEPTPYPCNPSPGSGQLSPPCEPEPPCSVSPPSSPPCEGPPPSPQTAFELRLDCDTSMAGVQSYCLAEPSEPKDVAVVITNQSGSDREIAAFNFTVNNADISIIDPLPGIDTSPPNLNNNPDFNDEELGAGGWQCLPVIPDLTPGGPSSESLLSCFNPQGSVPIADGESLVLGVIHYRAGDQPGSTYIAIEFAAFYDALLDELGSCNPTIYFEMNCHGSSVELPYPPPPPSGFEVAIDCDTAAAGVQEACSVTSGSAADVAIVAINESGRDLALGAFQAFLVNPDSGRLTPLSNTATDPPALDGNPDFNQAALDHPNWQCTPPLPTIDWTPGGPETDSLISCFNVSGVSDTIADGSSVVLATVHYTAGSPGKVDLTLRDAGLYDTNFSEAGACAEIVYAPMTCLGATVTITSGGPIGPPASPTIAHTSTAPPTNTPVPTSTTPPPPTSTVAPTRTPVPPTATAPATTPTRPARTATVPPRTATAKPTRTPTRGNRCADVNGDGRVTRADIREIIRRVHRDPYGSKYDINRSGKLSASDVAAALRQLGRSC